MATLSALGPRDSFPQPTAPGSPVSAVQPYPSAWKISTNKSTPQALRLRVTNVPGWHATIDGRPLVLQPFDGVMLEARVPPGAHTILFTYWPLAFTVGLCLAAVSAVGIVSLLVIEARLRRRSIPSSAAEVNGAAAAARNE